MKLIVLIGFSRGIGKEIFEQILPSLKKGEKHLLAIGRSSKGFKTNDCVTFHELDLLDNQCWKQISKLIPKAAHQVDLIFNAGVIEQIENVGRLEPFLAENAAKINFVSPIKITNEFVSSQKEINFQMRVFNITSGASLRPIEGWSLYCSTKAAFRMFLDVLNEESGPDIQIEHIDPGVVDTDMQRVIRDSSVSEMKNVQHFRDLDSSDKLKTPYQAASEVINIMRLAK